MEKIKKAINEADEKIIAKTKTKRKDHKEIVGLMKNVK
jgi:hypothetical protein